MKGIKYYTSVLVITIVALMVAQKHQNNQLFRVS